MEPDLLSPGAIREKRVALIAEDNARIRGLDLVHLSIATEQRQRRPICAESLRFEFDKARRLIAAEIDVIARTNESCRDGRFGGGLTILLRGFPQLFQFGVWNHDARIRQIERLGRVLGQAAAECSAGNNQRKEDSLNIYLPSCRQVKA